MSNVGRSLSQEGTEMNVLYSIICGYCIIFGVWSKSLKRSSKIENGNDKLTLKIYNCSHFKFIISSIYWLGNGTFCTRTSNSLMQSNKETVYKYKHKKNQLRLAITWSREQGIAFSYCMMSCCRVIILWTENELLFLISWIHENKIEIRLPWIISRWLSSFIVSRTHFVTIFNSLSSECCKN